MTALDAAFQQLGQDLTAFGATPLSGWAAAYARLGTGLAALGAAIAAAEAPATPALTSDSPGDIPLASDTGNPLTSA